jgi:DNA polymerase elongation subunit (family B)
MKIPLIASINKRTINLKTKKMMVKMYRNGEVDAVESPYIPYFYTEDKEGETKKLIASSETIQLKKHLYIPGKDHIPKTALFDGGREALLERLLIEQPKFFADYPNDKDVKCLVFDIETHSPDGTFPFGERYPIVAIGIVTSTGERKVFLWDNEKEDDSKLLWDFANYIQDYDPDIITGWNLVGYDIPQILHRVRYNHINESQYKKHLNRDGSAWGYEPPKDNRELKMNAGGRIVLDLLRWARLDYSLSGLPRGLKQVSQAFGLKPIELDFAEKNLLDYPLHEIEDYVLSDVDCTMFMYNHYFPQIQYVAEVLCVPLATYVNAPSSYITKILQGRSLFKQGIVALNRNKERHPDIFRFDKGNYQAAHIKLYKPGFEPRNYKVDFSSFYPSIAMALNLGPDTTRIVGYDEYTPDIEFKDGILYVPDNKVGKRLMIEIDTDSKSCLYEMCSVFKEMRKPYKLGTTKEDKSKSDALKIMVNTFYGANSNPYISYGDMGVGLTITAVARWLLLSGVDIIRSRYGEGSVVYVHTDGINTNVDVDEQWLTARLQKLLKYHIPFSEANNISMDKDVFKEGVWIQVGNYILRNLDGSVTKHGSTFKSKSRSRFYNKVLDRLSDARLNNTVTKSFVDKLYDLDEYILEDFIMRRSTNKGYDDYKTETDLTVQLMNLGKQIGMEPAEGTTYFYAKTKEGYRLKEQIKSVEEIDITYYWDTISNLLTKFNLKPYVKKKPPLTLLDKKQQSLAEWI